MAEHRVELVEFCDAFLHVLDRLARPLRQLLSQLGIGFEVRVREELVERRVDQTDRDRLAVHCLEQAGEVLPLERKQLGQGLFAVLEVVGDDHLADFIEVIEEHVLGAAEADAFRSERDGLFGLVRKVGVRPHAQLAMLVGDLHQLVEAAEDFRLFGLHRLVDEHLDDFRGLGRDLAFEDFASEAVHRQEVTRLQHLVADGDRSLVVVDVQGCTTNDAGLAHLPRHEGRVRGGATEGRENALGRLHAAKVFRAGFAADEDQIGLRILLVHPFGVFGEEDDFARGSARTGGDALGDQAAFLVGLLLGRRVEDRLEELVEVVRRDARRR